MCILRTSIFVCDLRYLWIVTSYALVRRAPGHHLLGLWDSCPALKNASDSRYVNQTIGNHRCFAFYHFATLRWHRRLNDFVMENKGTAPQINIIVVDDIELWQGIDFDSGSEGLIFLTLFQTLCLRLYGWCSYPVHVHDEPLKGYNFPSDG